MDARPQWCTDYPDCFEHLKKMTPEYFMIHMKKHHEGKTWLGYEIERCECGFIALNDMEMPHHRLVCYTTNGAGS